jgi:hypothetical protein
VDDLDSFDCNTNRRFLKESQNRSLVDIIQDAINSTNQALESVGIHIDGEIKPYFDSKRFAVGINSTLTVKFQQSMETVIDTIQSLLSSSLKPNRGGNYTNYTKLGFEDTSSEMSLGLSQLTKDTVILAGE